MKIEELTNILVELKYTESGVRGYNVCQTADTKSSLGVITEVDNRIITYCVVVDHYSVRWDGSYDFDYYYKGWKDNPVLIGTNSIISITIVSDINLNMNISYDTNTLWDKYYSIPTRKWLFFKNEDGIARREELLDKIIEKEKEQREKQKEEEERMMKDLSELLYKDNHYGCWCYDFTHTLDSCTCNNHEEELR